MLEFKSKLGRVFTIRQISEQDHPEVMDQIVKDHFSDEPISKALPPDQDRIDYFMLRIKIFLSQNLSVLAIDTTTRKIAGFAINIVNELDKNLVPPAKVLSPLRQFFSRLSKEVDFYKMFNVSVYGEIFLMQTSPEYRGQGLGNELFKVSMELLQKSNNLKVLRVAASSPYTRKIANRHGFKEECVIKFSEFKDYDGNLVFPNLTVDNDGDLVIESFVTTVT